mgnify:FL=1
MAANVETIEASLVAALGGLSGWYKSRYAYELLGFDANSLVSKTWAVGFPTTDFTDTARRRTNGPAGETGARVRTEARIRWLVRIRADNQASDISTAYGLERDLIQAANGLSVSGIGTVAVERITRRIAPTDPSFRISELQISIQHLYAVAG